MRIHLTHTNTRIENRRTYRFSNIPALTYVYIKKSTITTTYTYLAYIHTNHSSRKKPHANSVIKSTCTDFILKIAVYIYEYTPQ